MNKQLLETLVMKLIDDNNEDKSSYSEMWQVGKNYFIRTVTMHLVGKLVAVTDKELLLSKASWIADSGRFHTALKTGSLDEVEPFVNDVIVNRAAVIDATVWDHSIDLIQK